MTPLRTIGNDFTIGNCQENKLLRTWFSVPNRSSYRKNGKTLIIRMVAKTCQLSEKKKPEKDENCLLLSIILQSESEVDEKEEPDMKNKIIKICVCTIAIVVILCSVLMLVCNQIVVNNAKGKVSSDIENIKFNEVGLLLGTTPQARITKVKNYFFIYRIDAAEKLYKAGKIEKILISGDDNSLDGVNETECMRDSLVARGVPASAIVLDGKGYRTICSVINANKVYGLQSFTIISQKFHNERAIYQAEHLGLNVENIQAYNAKYPKSRRAYLITIREYFARVKLFLDILSYKKDYDIS
jgi:SanA protein